jgi:hypothetical protein
MIYNYGDPQPQTVGLNKNAPVFKYSTPQKSELDFVADK